MEWLLDVSKTKSQIISKTKIPDNFSGVLVYMYERIQFDFKIIPSASLPSGSSLPYLAL